MSVIRVGSTSKYAVGWDSIFGGGKATKKVAGAKRGKAKAAAAAKTGVKKAGKKTASKAAKRKAVTKARKPGKSRRG